MKAQQWGNSPKNQDSKELTNRGLIMSASGIQIEGSTIGDECTPQFIHDDTSSSDSDHWVDPLTYSTPPAGYWHVQKVVKFIKAGNQSSTTIGLACLKDLNLSIEFHKLAIRDIGGLEMLINLLETDDYNCIYGALVILSDIADHKVICRELINLGLIPIVVNLLQRNSQKIQNKAARLIAIAAVLKRSTKLIYRHGGIPVLITLCELPLHELQTPYKQLSIDQRNNVKTCAASTKALYSLSRSLEIKKDMLKHGILKLISKLLKSVHDEIVLYTMGFLQNCATEAKCQLAIETQDIVEDFMNNLKSSNIHLRELCSQAIFKSCQKEGPRKLVYHHGGCSTLVTLLKDKETPKHTNLMIALTGAIWYCALYDKNLQQLDSLGVLKLLLQFIKAEDEELLINLTGAIGVFLKLPKNRKVLHDDGVIKIFVLYLSYTNNRLLINIVNILSECAWDPDCMQDLENLDAVRLIWSLLKNPHHGVESNAAFAIVSCISNARESGELVRSLVGGLELLVSRLRSNQEHVVAGVCAAIAKVAKDRENLAIISEHGVLELLARHIDTKKTFLRQHLASAIAACCSWQDNCHMFGQLGVCTRIVEYIKTDNTEAKVTAAQALQALSFDPINCIILHRNGAVPYLLEAVSSKNVDLQMAAAGCLANIRTLALGADKIKYGCDTTIYKRKHHSTKKISFQNT